MVFITAIRQRNTTSPYLDEEMWIYGSYRLIPILRNGVSYVALPGGNIIDVTTLRNMASINGLSLRAPVKTH